MCGTSGLIPDIAALMTGNGATVGYYNDYANGPGAYIHDCDQIFFDGPTTRIEPGFLFLDGNIDTTFMFLLNGVRANFGALNVNRSNFWVQTHSQVRIAPLADTGYIGVCVMDFDGQQGFQVAANSSLLLAGVVCQNYSPLVVATAQSTILFGVPDNDNGLNEGSGTDAPTSTDTGQAITLTGFSTLVLTARTGFDRLGNQTSVLIGGTGNTLLIEGTAKTWANVISAPQIVNGSGAINRL